MISGKFRTSRKLSPSMSLTSWVLPLLSCSTSMICDGSEFSYEVVSISFCTFFYERLGIAGGITRE
jgi:hypothetical protein